MSRAAERCWLVLFRTAWRGVRFLPDRSAYRLFDLIAVAAHRYGGRDVEALRANYATVRPELDPAGLDRLVREGMRSYLRYWCDVFRLPDRSAEELAALVRCEGDAPVRADVAAGRGQVLFLGHLGNWDTAGAWATDHLAPVTTVAERLRPEELYAEFLAFREGRGMTVLPLTGEAAVFGRLVRAVRAGAFVPLLADRDLTRTGVEVDFCGQRAAMASGPAALAVSTGAPLRPVAVRYERRPDAARGPSSYRIVISFGPQVPDRGVGSTAERVSSMTQQCADYLGAAVQRHTEDWHMMQAVFVGSGNTQRDQAPSRRP
ncbi:MAG TPA: phosphatidylinositol mannoside acyltransferase [Ornithinimicrobium sp.]|uniref:phosphatidylinositol mannoside acyltransferase n=1 Tax=Ornithinimicrobium sp. TaxID=1977084 RepID=UPI002B4616A3|nr:phosphatidylinositol mannoside acyltransferase [Ornithinimicrobium sp.]HKJ11796.1 phosphatidylinositol mannoside acyltransferase [Ornithinimicrobium sp.]